MIRRLTRRAAASGLAAGVAGPALAGDGPHRVVSLNPCLDAILVQVADRAQIAAVSHYSHDPLSSSSGSLGRSFPFTYGSAEEIVALRPDLVLVTVFASSATRTALARLGVAFRLFGLPNTVEESLDQVRLVAAAVHRPARGEALVAQIRAAIARAAPPPGGPALSALVFQEGGLVYAPGTVMDDMLLRTGFTNAARRYGLTRSGNVPLERIIADPPDVLLAGEAAPGAPNWADRVLTHPALARVGHRMHRTVFPQQLTYCGGPVLIETAKMLARARREALEARA